MWSWSSARALLPALTALLFAGGSGQDAAAFTHEPRAAGGAGKIRVAELPPQARETLALIKRGGPFPYRKDGTTFFNRERRLPAQPRGYYSEYTVRTPGSRDRGARRIVAGRGATGNPASSGEYWYTADHYETFRRIRE